jgi:hypothetical protein
VETLVTLRDLVGAPQRTGPFALARPHRLAHHPRPTAEGAHDSARMTEIPLMSSMFISTHD